MYSRVTKKSAMLALISSLLVSTFVTHALGSDEFLPKVESGYDLEAPEGLPGILDGRAADPYFGDDRKVRYNNLTTAEFNHTMVSDNSGNRYVAWQDDYYDRDRIYIYSNILAMESKAL